MRALFVSIFIFLAATIGLAGLYVTKSSSTTTDKQPQVLAAVESVDSVNAAILAKINAVRSAAGVTSLSYSAAMKELTTARVTDMADKQYYSHTSPDGLDFGDMITDYDATSGNSCENLQLQIGEDWQVAVDAWIKSSTHYACLTDPNLSRAAGSVAVYDEVSYGDSSSPMKMYVFAFIATN